MSEVALSNLVPDGEKQRPFTSGVTLAGDGYVEEEWFLRADGSRYLGAACLVLCSATTATGPPFPPGPSTAACWCGGRILR